MPETQKVEPGVSPWSRSATPKYPLKYKNLPPPDPVKKISLNCIFRGKKQQNQIVIYIIAETLFGYFSFL